VKVPHKWILLYKGGGGVYVEGASQTSATVSVFAFDSVFSPMYEPT
jgi:hypothetical protein